jgi:hypothetical protein
LCLLCLLLVVNPHDKNGEEVGKGWYYQVPHGRHGHP